jgi:hypothetical protein
MEEVEDATAATLSAACGIPPAGPAMASSGEVCDFAAKV